MPNTDEVISVTREKSLTISRPSKRDALRNLRVFTNREEFRAEVINNSFRLQVPDFDGGTSSSAEPVAVRAEAESVDFSTSLKSVEVFALVEIPEHGNTVFTTRSTERTVRRDSNSVQVASVTNVVGAEFAVGKIPDFNEAVPANRDNVGVGSVGREADAGNPLSVSLVLDGVFALSQSVPETDGFVARTRNNLTVVSREGNRQDVVSVTNETTGSNTSVQVPQTESVIPRTRKSELTVRGDNNVRNEVVVTLETTFGDTIVGLVSGEAPVDERFVTRSRQDHVWGFSRGGDLGDPTSVSFKSAAES